ncbi:MAG: ROK family protein [bacterium]
MTRQFLGLDLGGTRIKAVLLLADGTIIAEHQVATPKNRQIEDVLHALTALYARFRDMSFTITAVGIGAPGLIDRNGQRVRIAPNFPSWRDVPLQDLLQREVEPPVFLDNDVNCFAFAEHRWGAAQGFQNVIALTVGTGVGGALIINGSLFRGSSGAAGELGHISVDLWGPECACGNPGCIERYIGERWFTLAAQETLGDDSIASPADISRLAQKGDLRAEEFIVGRGEILGVACTSLIHALDPEIIVIGGGIAQAGEPFFRGVRKSINERAYKILADQVKVTPAKLGTIAGAMGAAALGLNQVENP